VPTKQDYELLLAFRVALRQFNRWAEALAEDEGLTHNQHQLLVAIKGHREAEAPTVGDLAGYLLLQPHSAVELIDRAEAAGLVRRVPDSRDARMVRVRLTSHGGRIVSRLTPAVLERLSELSFTLALLVEGTKAEMACP
jgi:DNA-binding MarR family transcriptional regulator